MNLILMAYVYNMRLIFVQMVIILVHIDLIIINLLNIYINK